MIHKAVLQMELFAAAKETDNKLRWDADVDGATFSLYIPKWRVPVPWPSRIWLDIRPRRLTCDDLPNLTQEEVGLDGTLRGEPIVATVIKHVEHTRTVRYRPLPVGKPQECEIGEPYIPFPLTFGKSDRLRLIVLWDITARGNFREQVADR